MKSKQWIEQLVAQADIRINGDRPWDIVVRDDRFFDRVIRQGSLGLGEAYMEGWWDATALDQLFTRILSTHLEDHIPLTWTTTQMFLTAYFGNAQRGKHAFTIGKRHYDVGNELYQVMLDKRLMYTCGYWEKAQTLDEAQEAKLDLVCRKIGLQKGQRVLDIGCGWGGFARYAAEKYGAEVVGITVSKEQLALGEKICRDLPIELRYQDYRSVDGSFDHIISLGMFEHVGVKNYREYMRVAARCLKDDGLFLLHTIGSNTSGLHTDPWIEKYIFPNSMLPSAAQIATASESIFVMEDWHNFGVYYDRTLMAWWANFENGWPQLQFRYSEEFYRMWKYYLLSCAGSFRSRRNQLWQIVFSKRGVRGGYTLQR